MPPIQPANDLERAKLAIAGIESGSNYNARGPANGKGQRAYGKYQVMDFNIPSWTKEALGQSLTPEQFINNPRAQEKVFEHKFGQYAQKYGNYENAAKVWFGGEGALKNPGAKDILGTSVAEYAQRFTQSFGGNGYNAVSGGGDLGSSLPQQPTGNLQSFAAALDEAVNLARQKRNASSLAMMMPFQGTVAASDFNGILGNLNQASDTRTQDLIKRAGLDAETLAQGDELLSVTEAQSLGVPYGTTKAQASSRGITPSKGTDQNVVSDNERALLAQFVGSPIVKNYNEVVSQKLYMDNIVANGVGGPADLALVFTFMKGLDPTSVVRETEYENARKSGNIFSGAFAKFNGYFKENGGFLPPAVQKEFQNLVNQKLKAQQLSYDNFKKGYEDIAKRQGLDPANVVLNFDGALVNPASATSPTSGTTSSGIRYTVEP